ncbi:MAG: sel1 repeat family protein [Lentisphaeria bacterium]|nr:sel1 repeat family protein [Lentisphaeria bacterium]
MKLTQKLMIGAVAAVLSFTSFADNEFKIISAAAEKGNAVAQLKLGDFYFHGENVGKSYIKAMEWYEKAADQGNAEAMCNLGVCYQYGFGAKINDENLELAVKWYKKAAEKGYARAQYHLANYLENRKIDDKIKDQKERDAIAAKYREEAFPWYKKAAEGGYALAQYKLGRFYEQKNNKEEAAKWYKKAADQGNAHALARLIVLGKPFEAPAK